MECISRLRVNIFIFVVCLAVFPAQANDLEDGKAALELKDYPKASELLSPLAQGGDSTAQYYLGYLSEFGLGRKIDKVEAFHWYEKSAAQGYDYSQSKLGVLYELGEGVKKDLSKAAVWYSKAAEQGNVSAQGNLGRLYEIGKGVPKSIANAVIWYKKAADQGDSATQSNLGNLYSIGKGVPQDFEQARVWYTKSAMQGNTTALFNLGVTFRDGYGVDKNFVAAYIYFNLSAIDGASDAKVERASMSRRISSDDLKTAQQVASAWKVGDKLPYLDDQDKNSANGGDAEYSASEKIDHFEVTLYSCSVKSHLGLKNKSAEPKSAGDSEFLILDVSFKNVDTESRMPLAGSVFINYNGKRYQFDNPETIWQDGWDLRFGKINPLLTERTKLVYKIPLHMRGDAEWIPGRNQTNVKLTCGI